jgi:diguanylate cyclase (GGDEF)-like protein
VDPVAADSDEQGVDDPLGLLGRRDFSLLVVDDSAGLREEVKRLAGRLEVFGEINEAHDGIDAFKKVMASKPDLILCDLIMPTVDGLKFLTMLYSRPEFRDVPVIMLTGRADSESKIRGLELGASDYVTKPFDEGELLARIKVQLKIKALQDTLKGANKRLWELSTVDVLTGLFNRRYFMESLEREVDRSRRYKTPLTFIMMDIDFFKKLNDNHGHQAGDDVLKSVGATIKESVRTSDIPGRYGGEEFCVILPETDLDGAILLADRLNEAIRNTPIETVAGTLGCTVSVGVSCFSCLEEPTGAELIHVADTALYEAKESGRDRVVSGSKKEEVEGQ